jgi:hypothetical protein
MITKYPKAMPNANENRMVRSTIEEGKNVLIFVTSVRC